MGRKRARVEDKENSGENVWTDASLALEPMDEEDADLKQEVKALRAKLAEAQTQLQERDEAKESFLGSGKESDRMQKLVNDKRKLALEVATLKEEKTRAEARAASLAAKVTQLEGGVTPASTKASRGRARGTASKGEEDSEAKELKTKVKELDAQVEKLKTQLTGQSQALEKALKSGETSQLKLSAAQKAGADTEKKLALAQTKTKQLEAKVKELQDAGADLALAQAAADDLDSRMRAYEEASVEASAQLQAKSEEVSQLKKEVLSLKTQLASQDKADKPIDPSGLEQPSTKSRKRGRYSIQDTANLMDKLTGIQSQFLEIQKAGAALKNAKGSGGGSLDRSASFNRSSSGLSREGSRDSGGSDTFNDGRRSSGRRSSSDRRSSACALADKDAEIQALTAQVADLEAALKSEKEFAAQAADCEAANMATIAKLQDALAVSDGRRKALLARVMELQGNIRVFCRLRPFMPSDAKTGDAQSDMALITSGDRPKVQVTQPSAAGGKSRQAVVNEHEFDNVFMHNVSQQTIFAEVEPLLHSVMDGYRLCIFAYGQTGSGKTHTMQGRTDKGGEDPERGLVPRAMETLMEVRRAMQANGWTVSFEVSALEIYNENIRDLLTDSVACDKSKLDIVMDAKTGETYVKNLSSETVSSEQDIYSLLNLAASRRETAATVHNAVSSRSHSVVQLKVLMSHKKNREKRCGRLNLIDLAGSEKVTSEHDKTQFNEAKNINKSLSSLLGCIQALASGKGHVPFRESKLTYLLQSSLSGDGKAVMFANISPRIQHLPESLNTLRSCFPCRPRLARVLALAPACQDLTVPSLRTRPDSPSPSTRSSWEQERWQQTNEA